MIDTTQIKENMTVYDAEGNRLGKVEFVKYSDEDPNNPGPETVSVSEFTENTSTLVRIFAEAVGSAKTDLPEEVEKHLMRTGYIRLGTRNIFKSDRYFSLDQVSGVLGNNIYLSAPKSDLVAI